MQPLQGGQPPSPRRENSLRGIGLVLLGGAFLSSADAVSKLMAETVPPLQITWLRYAAFAVIMLAIALIVNNIPKAQRYPQFWW